jgi:hypothetical protein
MSRTGIKISYTRYADDWIVLTKSLPEVEKLKAEIGQIRWDRTRLRISEEKTKITQITKEPAKLLGFTIRNAQNMARPKTVITEKRKYKAKPSWGLFVGIDTKRVLFRLKLRRIIDEKHRPMANPLMIHLKDHEIIEKYAQMT